MNIQTFILLVALVALTRFFKGMFSRTKNENSAIEEIADFGLHTIIVVIIYIIIYGAVILFS